MAVKLKRTERHIPLFLFLTQILVCHTLSFAQDQNEQLLAAARSGNNEKVQILIHEGADVNARDSENKTPLILAIENGHNATVSVLLKSGAETETFHFDKLMTPVMYAVRLKKIDIIKTLLDAGAYLFWMDIDNKTARDYAIRNGHTQIIALLDERLKTDPLVQVDKNWRIPYEDEITTEKYEVLDINWERGLVAFKHIYKLRADHDIQMVRINDTTREFRLVVTDSAVDCNYIGMQKYPGSGVIMGAFDLKNDKYLKVFTVYKSVMDMSECMSHEDSKRALEEAKLYFDSLGLDIYKKPFSFPVGPDKTITLTPDNITLNIRYRKIQAEIYFHTLCELCLNNQALFIQQQLNMRMGPEWNSPDVKFIRLFRNQNKILALVKQQVEGFDDGIPLYYEKFSFTPIIELPPEE